MAGNESDFTVVKSKRKSKNQRIRTTVKCTGATNLREQEDEVDSNEIVKKVLKLKSDVLNDQYTDIVRGSTKLRSFHPSLMKAPDGLQLVNKHFVEQSEEGTSKLALISYGIGNFASCLIARYQLALLLVMRDELLDSVKKCEVYDPIFTSGEKESLHQLNLVVIPKNEEGKRKVDNPTVFYMPHCGKALYNNLLWANWSPATLENLAIIGNSLSQMLESIPSSIMKNEASYIYKIDPYTEELPLENKFHFDDIFNNTSIHMFKKDIVCKAENSLWSDRDEPIYDSDDVEIILSR